MFKIMLRQFLVGRGYTRYQARALIAKLDWQRVRDIILQYGPTLIEIFLALLPLFLAMEAPLTFGQSLPADEEEDYSIEANLEIEGNKELIVLGKKKDAVSYIRRATQMHGIPICICYLNPDCPVHGPDFIEPGTCTRPPEGWFCTKEEGHEGPCPTHRK